ncbi:hypothetical protein BU23DRAFT_580254 [Bimuria novae-zelandiae CBS 107.79]|uniref:Uncharacterized protein n=1 Tax=Bimuria novae-zelandiae CBS 107.79 TaxID=1447943 RepID=A0A6A5VJF5_9PLEO|nr:hypothetical protein BU23DRAFT_580254 [Bimuria novae-zelandiae CBS 107.79]
MWFVNTVNLELEEFFDTRTPPYATLSHTWGDHEVSFSDMRQMDLGEKRSNPAMTKIAQFCRVVLEHGFQYGWVDTCCIDKRNSCVIYFTDVKGTNCDSDSPAQLEAVRSSRWFKRGWTLQELLAPRKRCFTDLLKVISKTTNISTALLRDHDLLSRCCIAERMSWASYRQTTRSEGIAYSLMRIFHVNMPVLYGEGVKNAFRRLQLEILKTSFDQSIFAWRGAYDSSGLIASSPSDFAHTPNLSPWQTRHLAPFSMTNVGLSIRIPLIAIEPSKRLKLLMLYLMEIPGSSFYANGKISMPGAALDGWPYQDIYILENEHFLPLNPVGIFKPT